LFRRDEIEAYLRLLSAHPGRRVEASIASAGEPGLIVLDYLVTELRSWQVYSQISNTGTETTGRWRGRLGFQHNQLTNYDDVLSLDLLSTANAENVAGFVSYRRPLFRPGSFSARIYGSFGDFAASGTAFENLRFVGDNWMAGAEIMHRRALGRAWDLSLALGANYTVYSVATTVSGVNITRGESPFLVPFFNAALARETDWWSIAGGLRVEHSIDGVADDNPATGYRSLGRTGATAEWTSIRTAVDFRIFLEPLFSRKSPPSTLAHEAAVRVRGRFLPTGGRLVPQEQELMGGAYSVRGYPESVASADEAVTFSAEYAYHVPRSLRSGERGTLLGRPFAWRPPQPLRRPDWDLILRGFVDYGHRWVEPAPNSRRDDPPPLIERNLALLGVGGGVEVTVKHYVSLRCDIGFALNELKDEDNTWARAGEARAHLTASFHW
jgi:hemolysin activation/secretion protein